jgi:SAM-dependent methyltransferase
MTQMALKQLIDQRFYANYGDGWTSRDYRAFVSRHLTERDVLLDYGAGRGAEPLHGFRGLVARTAGVDIDDAVLENPHLDEAKVMAMNAPIPYPDGTFDVVVSANVLEHVEDPRSVFMEIRRVLRPGGLFLFKTPNKHHYVPTVARLTPHPFHLWVNRRRGVPDCDTFPTVYHANTPGTIRRLSRESGFEVESLETIEGRPEYLRAFLPLYPLGILYERTVNAIPALAPFRVVMLGALRKPR